MRVTSLLPWCFAVAAGLHAQTADYFTISTVAGQYPLGDGGPATAALLFGPRGVTVGNNGDIFVADSRNRSIRRINAQGVISTFFVREGYYDIAFDPISGAFFTSENNTGAYVYRISPLGVRSIYAGNGNPAFGGDGARATLAAIQAYAVAVDPSGNLYIADGGNHRIRKVTPDGIITTIAGSGLIGSAGDGGKATDARLAPPTGVAVDRSGIVYISDTFNHRIRRVALDGTISTVAGNGDSADRGDGGNPTLAAILLPTRLAVDNSGNLYVATNNRVRRVSASGVISAYAGSGNRGITGDGGPAVNATFNNLQGIAVHPAGGLLICDSTNDRIRRVDGQGVITTFAGAGHYLGDNGPAAQAVMKFPAGVAVHRDGAIYVTDQENHRIRAIDGQGVIRTVLGNGLSTVSDGPLAGAGTSSPQDVVFDGGGTLFFTDWGSNRIRKITPAGIVATVAGVVGAGAFGGDDSPATVARLNQPSGLTIDANGNIYFADTSNHRIRKVSVEGVITTVAGSGQPGFSGDGGPAIQARLRFPQSVAVDRNGAMYISDTSNNRVRRVEPNGTINTYAGSGVCCEGGDNGPARSANLGFPWGLLLDGAGNLYVSNWIGNQIRRVSPSGTIIIVAGTGDFGFSGDGGVASVARIDGPTGMVFDGAGNILFVDQYNHRAVL